MIDSISSEQLRQESRLVFAMLDAIYSEGLIIGTENQTRWMALKGRVNTGASYDDVSFESYELLTEVAHSGAIKGTWMENRWLTIDARIRVDH